MTEAIGRSDRNSRQAVVDALYRCVVVTDFDPPFPEGRSGCRFYESGGAGDAVFAFRRLDHKSYRVTTQFDYVDRSHQSYRVPCDVEDNTTDLASVPAILTWLVPRDGRHTPAAVLHDALIGGRNGSDYIVSSGDDVTDRQADYLFREAMAGLGVPWLRRWMMWAAVALRTLTMSIDSQSGRSELQYVRVVPVAIIVIAWGAACALMALDVPDISRPGLELPWLGDRPWWQEIPIALGMIAIGATALAGLFGLVLRSVRGVAAGAVAGVAIGFLALPMLASAVGFAIYSVLETILSALLDRRRSITDDPLPYEITVEPDPERSTSAIAGHQSRPSTSVGGSDETDE